MSVFGGAFNAAYKHIYNPKRVEMILYRTRPFLKKLEKRDGMGGDNYNHTIFYEAPQGGSVDFATAQNNQVESSQGARMIINRGREYAAIQISNEEMAASEIGPEGSLLQKKKTETDNVLNEMGRRIDIACHGAGCGVLASFTTPASLTGVNTITLDVPALYMRFSVKLFLQCSSTNNLNGTPNTLLNSGASAQIVGVSEGNVTSTLTLDQNLTTAWPSIATSTQYFLLRKGDNVGFGQNIIFGSVSGLKAWLPIVAPTTGDAFWGFDRSVDAQKLSGIRYVAQQGEKYEQTFMNASAQAYLAGANPSLILVNPLDWAKYTTELGNKVRFEDDPADQTIGARRLMVRGQGGTDLELVSDPQVDPGLFYMLDMDTWFLFHLRGVPHLDESDGRPAARVYGTDAITFRWRSWHQLICTAPGYNVVGQFAA